MKQITSILKFCIVFLAFIVGMNVQGQSLSFTKNGQAAGNKFGTAVSLSGDGQVIAVGSPYSNANGVWAGQVKIYNFYGNQMGAPINGASSDRSGSAISLSQNGYRIAIGNSGLSGKVRIFDWNGTAWVQAGNTLNEYQVGDQFGTALSLSANGMRLAVGASGTDSNGSDAGQVRIYDWNGNAWNPVGAPINGNSYTSLGYSVSLSANGTTVAIGAPLEGGSGITGKVRLYSLNGNTWAQKGSDINGTPYETTRFGDALSISADGNRVVIGAPKSGYGNFNQAIGMVRVYDYNGGNWIKVGDDLTGEPNDAFGSAVSLSADGSRLAVGAEGWLSDPGSGTYAKLYRWQDNNWTAIGVNAMASNTSNDYFGTSVSLSANGNYLAVGAPFNSSNGAESGRVSLYSVNDSPPTALCKNVTVALDATGTTTIGANTIDNGSTDNQNGYSLSINRNTFTSTDIGTTVPVTFTITDTWGQTASCTAQVTVVDTISPTISCVQDALRSTDSGGLFYTVVGNEFDASFSDNAADATLTNDFNDNASLAGAVLPLGDTLVTWTVVDGSGNSNSCQMTVTVADTEAPTISCVQDVNRSNDLGLLTYTVLGNELDPSFSDNAGNAGLTNDFNGTASLAGAVFPLGETLVTWTVVDPSGNSNSCEMIILVEDTETPVITCVQNTTRETDSGLPTYAAQGTEFNASFSDNAGDVSLTNDFNGTVSLAGAVFPLGETLVTWTVVDPSGNSNSCEMIILVEDTETPVITCVQNTTRETDSGLPTYAVQGTEFNASFSDNAGDVSLTNDFNGTVSLAGAVFPLGETLVTWTLVDGSGNSNSCQITVTVVDTEAPAISCAQDATQSTDPGGLSYTVVGTEFDASFSDNAADATLTNDFNGSASLAAAVLPLGDTLVTWTVDDGSGNSNSCAMTVTVVDTEAPGLSCSENLSLTVLSSSCTIPVIFNTPVVQDNASLSGSVIQTAGLPSGSEFPVGTTTNTFEATDAAGNTATCSFDVTVTVAESSQENMSVIAGNANDMGLGLRVSMSADGLRMAVYNQINVSGSNAQVRVYQLSDCGWMQLGSDIEYNGGLYNLSMSADGSRLVIGARVYTWDGSNWLQLGADIFEDEDGSYISVSISADGSRLAIGTTEKSTSSNNVRVYTWDGSNWLQLGSDIVNETPDNDRFGFGFIVSMSADGSRLAIGAPDTNDNFPGSENGYVQVYTWDGSNWVQLGGDIIGEADGDFSGISVSLSADGSRLAIGATVNNGGSNSSSPVGHVRVYTWDGGNWIQLGPDIDGELPGYLFGTSVSMSSDGSRLVVGSEINAAYYGGDVVVYTWDGSNWIQLVDIDGEATYGKNVGSISMSADGLRLAIGATFNTRDSNLITGPGNILVYNLPDTAPVALCQDITVQLDASGSAIILPSQLDGGSNDTQGTVTLSLDNNTFDCTDIGTPVRVTLTVTDSIGQTASCTATVTVEDNEVPVITCAESDVRNTDTGTSEYTIQGTEFDASFTDNCTDGILTNDFNGNASLAGAVLPLGDTLVTWTAVDGSGNTAHCSTTLTVNASIVDETSLLSSYTIIGRKGVSLLGTKVTGGVGVKGLNRVARIWGLSTVNGFVKSKHIWRGWWSSVDTLIYERTTVSLPDFHENTADRSCGVNITVAPSQTLTLTDQIYNNITVRQGGTLIIASPEVYINKLSTATNTTIRFNQSSAVMINKTLQLGGNTTILQNANTVTFYVEKEVTVGPGSQVDANIYTKQNLRLQPSSYRNKTRMIGQFIALNEVYASANSVWTSIGSTLDTAPLPNGPDNCAGARSTVANQSTEMSHDTDLEITITKDVIALYPVPTRDVLNIKLNSPQAMSVNYSIVSVKGNIPINQTWDLTEGENITKVDVSRLSEGQYYILFSVAGQQISKPFIIVSGR